MSEEIVESIIAEAKRKCTDSLYAGVILFEWSKSLRLRKNMFLFIEVSLGVGCIISAQLENPFLAALFGGAAGLGPFIVDAFGLDKEMNNSKRSANEFRKMSDKFRRVEGIWSKESVTVLKRRFEEAVQEYESVCDLAPIAPSRFFKKAQKKIKAGDYTHDDTKSD